MVSFDFRTDIPRQTQHINVYQLLVVTPSYHMDVWQLPSLRSNMGMTTSTVLLLRTIVYTWLLSNLFDSYSRVQSTFLYETFAYSEMNVGSGPFGEGGVSTIFVCQYDGITL